MAEAGVLSTLSDRELEALTGAATWYAKYHSGVIAERAGDTGAMAVEDRRRYLDLVAALRKVGVRVRVPDALLDEAQAA